MRTKTSLIVLFAAALLGIGLVMAPVQQADGAGAQGDGKAVDRDRYQKMFKDHGDFVVGGVWHGTDAKGTKQEARYEWILDKSFIRMTFKGGDDAFELIGGIDAATGRSTYWGFDNKGRIFKGVVESDKAGEWTFRDSGQGKDGSCSYKGKEVKLGADSKREDLEEMILDGKKLPLESVNWTRKK